LDRREALKFLAAGAATAALPPQVLAAFREIHANLPQTPVLGILNAHQDATLSAAAELLLPATETPGAKAVRVNEFIDHILADWYSQEDRKIFLEGLADMDARRNFVARISVRPDLINKRKSFAPWAMKWPQPSMLSLPRRPAIVDRLPNRRTVSMRCFVNSR
jgi:hypothetical protein